MVFLFWFCLSGLITSFSKMKSGINSSTSGPTLYLTAYSLFGSSSLSSSSVSSSRSCLSGSTYTSDWISICIISASIPFIFLLLSVLCFFSFSFFFLFRSWNPLFFLPSLYISVSTFLYPWGSTSILYVRGISLYTSLFAFLESHCLQTCPVF